MKAVGVIVEYNPFHNGHAFHLQKAKEISNGDIAIAVMSGNFLQRGEPALVSKWARTKMALEAGCDIVFELPYPFATQKAKTFASGAVSILGAAGCESFCFGSESGSMEQFLMTYDFLTKNNPEYQEKIKSFMDTGLSFPSATSKAFQEISQNENDLVDLSKPNNILGYHYLLASIEQKQKMKIHTISRKNAQYHDETFTSESIASATSIRKALFSKDGQLNSLKSYVPDTTFRILLDYYHHFQTFHQWENYWPYLKYRLLQLSAQELKQIYEVEEGLENRILSIGQKATSFKEFMTQLKTKRYTWTRLQRMCVHILTNTSKKEMMTYDEKASYLRLLGMSSKGREYLKVNKSNFQLPVISKLSSYQKKEIELDIKAARIFALGAPADTRQALIELEYNQPPILLS